MARPSTAAARLLSGAKEPVRVASAGENVDIAAGGLTTIDGVALAVGDRVLLKNQTNPVENGIYTAAEGEWYRAPDADGPRSITKGVMVAVQEGTILAGEVFEFATVMPEIGTDEIYVQFMMATAIAGVEEMLGDAEAAAAAAAASEAAATAASTSASTAETAAETAQAAAEAARDMALVAGDIYADTTAGLAATSEGGYFLVPAAGPDELFILYREIGGVATEIKRYANASASSAEVAVNTLKTADLALSHSPPPAGTRFVDLWIGIGQSNARFREYAAGETNVMDYAIPEVYMPVSGQYESTYADISVNPYAFVPAGSNFASYVAYEATINGSKLDGIAVAARRPTVLMTAAHGARDYTELRRGNGSYAGAVGYMLRMSKLLRADGYAPRVKIFFSHGEAEGDLIAAGGGAGSATPYATYRQYLSEWCNHLQFDAAVTMRRPSYKPPIFAVGFSLIVNDAYRDVLAAQTDHFLEADGCYHIGPAYQFPIESDNTHSTGLSNVLLGEMTQKVARYVETGEDWKPLHMRNFRRSGATVTVQCHVPRGNLTLDTTLVADAGTLADPNVYGIQFFRNGVALTVNSVAISGGDNLIVTLSADPGAAVSGDVEEVRAAMQTQGGVFAKARANFRDQDAVYSTHDPSVILYNWMVAQKLTVTTP